MPQRRDWACLVACAPIIRRIICESLLGRGSRGKEGKRVVGGRLKREGLDRRTGQRKRGLGARVSCCIM
ncbi:hypothetical protein PITC_018180 [Penicillium italicum]|uniref:Uncharacterized protein n=1 Tax=Penicillium italicum TaxID=40296 RepID=A0A0A2LB04_PENIT|nr:hypothetical protein PITC_018180 [Penicillium italicum]